jgi:hypothetical protein
MFKIKAKKGDITDILSLVIVLFVLIVGFFIISFTIPQISNGLKTAGLNNSNEGANAINSLTDFGTNGIQKGMFWLFIGMCIGVLISAFYADTHPIWLFLYIIMLVISIILAAYLGNAYQTMTEIDAFSGWSQSFMTMIMQNIMKVIIGVAAMSFIIMFVKGVFFGGYGGTNL